jgi:hypothetical protein
MPETSGANFSMGSTYAFVNRPLRRQCVGDKMADQTILLAATRRSAEASTMAGDFPPSSSVTGVKNSAAAFIIC